MSEANCVQMSIELCEILIPYCEQVRATQLALSEEAAVMKLNGSGI